MSAAVRVTLAEARVVPIQPGTQSSLVMQHGSMKLRFYAPRGPDLQRPHEQDELYVVASGGGTFFVGGQRVPFEAGDVLFVTARVDHRFESFSDDFATWVAFYGPPGGEAVAGKEPPRHERMMPMSKPVRATLEEAKVAPIPPGSRSSLLMQHGSMKLRYYAPRGSDLQTPHDQDELYVIASGRGTFFVGGQRMPFGPGDVLFVAAHVEHRFEAFSDDFGTWVVFYGPSGGEGG